MEEDCTGRREHKGGRPRLGNLLVFRKQPRGGHLGSQKGSGKGLHGAIEGTELLQRVRQKVTGGFCIRKW